MPTDPEWAGDTLYDDVRQRRTDPATLWRVIESIGADHGMSASPLAWSLRGWIRQLTSAAGIRRGSRNVYRLHSGEALDWWRVEHIDGPDSCGYVPTSHCQADSGWNCPRDPTRKEVPSTANVYGFNPIVIAGKAFGTRRQRCAMPWSAVSHATSPAPPTNGPHGDSPAHAYTTLEIFAESLPCDLLRAV